MTQQTFKLHVQKTKLVEGNAFLEINNKAEELYNGKLDVDLPDGWHYLGSSIDFHDYRSHFKAIVLQNNDQFAIVFFGTDFKSPKDLGANGKMLIRQEPKQFKDALAFTKQIMEERDIAPENLSLIGNSEGGSEGIYVMSKIDGIQQGMFFNAYPPQNVNIDEETQSRIYNFRHVNDVVSKCGPTIGNEYIVGYKKDFKSKIGTPEFVNAHRIINMGDLREAIPANEYKKQHPEFKNKIREGKLKSYEIQDIPDELFTLAEPDINDRLKNGMVVNEKRPEKTTQEKTAKVSQCVGSYPVSGYTRADGTKVSDYVRTCGAAHNGNNPNKMSSNIVRQKSSNGFVPNERVTPNDIIKAEQEYKKRTKQNQKNTIDSIINILLSKYY